MEPFEGEEAGCPLCGTPNCTSPGHPRPGEPFPYEPVPHDRRLPTIEQRVIVDRLVYEHVDIPHSKTGTRILKYRPGDRITPDEARRVGILPIESTELALETKQQ